MVERLLHIHYHGWALPERLQAWLAGQLRRSPALADQPIERWLADRRVFFIFLEDQWRSYLRQQGQTLAQSESLAEPGPLYQLAPLAVDFPAWLHTRYDALHSLPYLPQPILGHQVAHFLAHRLRQDAASARVALLVLDGLALDQWQIVRDAWRDAGQPWRCDEQALLAVLPTVTPIARQALFAGQLPLYFPDTWQRTDQDSRRWQRFWQDQGLPPSAAAWQLGGEQLDHTLADSRVRALGLVLGNVDKMLHGTVHGRAELHARVRHWLERGELTQVVQRILAAGFDLWLTSDHGNTAAVGVGRPREGVLVEQRGGRVRFYNDPAFQARAAGEVAEALAIFPVCHPDDRLILHWGMVLLAYPLFGQVAGAAGRLLRLQGSFRLAQLNSRIAAQWGHRSTLDTAVPRIVYSLLDWQALVGTEQPGVYQAGQPISATDPATLRWLLEASMTANGSDRPLSDLLRAVELFPFDVAVGASQVTQSPRLQVYQQGQEMTMVHALTDGAAR